MPLLQTFGNDTVRGYRRFGPTGGGPSDYELISTTILGSNTASITFSGLGTSAAAYKHLQLRVVDRSSAANSSQLAIRFNSDTGSNYSEHQLIGNGSAVSSYGGASVTFAPMGNSPESGNTANVFGARIIDILDFASTTKNKTIRELKGYAGSAVSIGLHSSAWYSTAAVTSMDVFENGGNFIAGSRFSLYGLKG